MNSVEKKLLDDAKEIISNVNWATTSPRTFDDALEWLKGYATILSIGADLMELNEVTEELKEKVVHNLEAEDATVSPHINIYK